MTHLPGADDGTAVGAPTDGSLPPVALDEPALPAALQRHADAVLVVQQRIERLELPPDVAAELSRELRRAVQAARVDVTRGSRRLDRLQRRVSALEA